MNVGIVIPGDTNNKPATHNRVAIKEKVFNSFFNILMTENTIVALVQMFFLLLRIFLVLRLSLRSNQAKNLIVGTHLDFLNPSD
jgi:hypothetical protein